MTYSFRPAKRSEAKPLIGLYAESGAGKTLSALLLARGFAGPTGKVGMIETESGRGEAYADDPRIPGGYAVLSLREDFSPRAFGEALSFAEKAELDALILDSASHEWDAVGGVRHMAAMNEEQGKKGMLVWQTPKMDHQRHFMLPLLSTPIPLVVLCMRARYPMEENPTKKGDWKRGEHLVPYQSDTILFEMFAHGWIDRAHCFHGTKYTREGLREVIRENEPITLETGQRLAAWAKGGATASKGEGERPEKGDSSLAPIPGATSGGGSGGADLDMIAADFAARFDEVTTVKEGQEWSAQWEAARRKHPFTSPQAGMVEDAKVRARERVKARRR